MVISHMVPSRIYYHLSDASNMRDLDGHVLLIDVCRYFFVIR